MDAAGERSLVVRSARITLGWSVLAVAAVAAAFVVGTTVGPVHIPLSAIASSALARLPLVDIGTPLPATEDAIVWQLRVPRVVLAALVGAMLAVAGASYQGVFRNPLADPYLLGVAAGAGLGATVAITYGASGNLLLPLAAFAGAVVAVLLTYAIGRSFAGERTSATLILAGVTVAAFLTSVQTFVQQQNTETLNEVYAWLLGGLSTAGWRDVLIVLPYVAVSAVVLLVYRRTMDVFAVGDDEARSLGLDVGRTRIVIVAAATLGTAAAVAVSGLIAFVGIIVPHLVRLALSSSYRVIVPLSLALGASFLVLADVVARTALAPAELPIGVVTAFVGGPFFALVLRTSRAT